MGKVQFKYTFSISYTYMYLFKMTCSAQIFKGSAINCINMRFFYFHGVNKSLGLCQWRNCFVFFNFIAFTNGDVRDREYNMPWQLKVNEPQQFSIRFILCTRSSASSFSSSQAMTLCLLCMDKKGKTSYCCDFRVCNVAHMHNKIDL